MKTKKASVLLMSLALIVILGFLSSIGYLINQKMSGNDDLDIFESNSTYDSFQEQEQSQSQQEESSSHSINFGPIKIIDTAESNSSFPDSVSNLEVTARGSSWIYWEWKNPGNADFKESIVYVAGRRIVTSHDYLNVTGLQANREYTIVINTRDNDGNVNPHDVTDTERTLTGDDTEIPDSITSLAAVEAGPTWIYWTWANPTDADFAENIIFIDDEQVAITSDNQYQANGLLPNTNYTITVHSRDVNGNVNNADVSNTHATIADSTSPASVSNLRVIARSPYSLEWEWVNPRNADFKENLIFLNGVSYGILNSTTASYKATGLNQNTNYIFTVQSRDTSGNLGAVATNSTKTCIQVCSYGSCWVYECDN